MSDTSSQQKLGLFDVTNLVIGAAVGADIYVVASAGSADLGPANLLAWIVAGIFAVIIAINFAKCATVVTEAGGSYAYVRETLGDFPGFIVGWAFWLAEVATIAVFPVAFVQYLGFFFPALPWVGQAAIKAALVAAITYTIIRGTKAAGRTNDVLTLAKLTPLMLLVLVGAIYLGTHMSATVANFTPFAPLGFGQFEAALVVIFWAYAGFEFGVIPSDNVENPQKTLPKAMVLAMTIVALFYVVINAVVIGAVNWTTLANSQTPVITAASTVFSFTAALGVAGGIILGVGALLTVSGSDESGSFSLSGLSRALARDGWFPRIFDEEHPKYHTPYKGMIIQSAIARSVARRGAQPTHLVFGVQSCLHLLYDVSFGVCTTKGGEDGRGSLPSREGLEWVHPFCGDDCMCRNCDRYRRIEDHIRSGDHPHCRAAIRRRFLAPRTGTWSGTSALARGDQRTGRTYSASVPRIPF